ncbi:MAG: thiamine pyrophosphate-binding protein [Aeromicrobium sp.]|uniref:thiamine pyrophosphate-binding protein n=1 Tax=Aeromicrobium sp. TaxID=1871063 RepID=UPI0025BDAD37|nr:thiamine pyrophosphate-binding protein [Aeromicrobium sp.]MCK5892062.1 2-succinyl-5-enolpyruvyl-6-hydroxy-3-cyclohexene-1-carboxylic-acid synthase [Aeromicrobium sp.]MDF1704279.1 thiamine pyrophosphate-binding protein [Aeromicrobium sp.]
MSAAPESVETARLLVERLLGLGATEAVLAPGSRSGPLALALHAADAQGLMRLHVRVDEREAGFLALGMSKVTGLPVPVVTTSGTAVANLHPAMLEAWHTGARVVAVTADRPARMRGTGASQTTDQREIFPRVRFVDTVEGLRPSAGPVHLNLELDEPLIENRSWYFEVERCVPPVPMPMPGEQLAPGPRTVVVAGDGAGPEARRIADSGGWPLLAEPSSGARDEHAIGAYRLILAGHPVADRIERVVCLGHPTLSRPVTSLLLRDDIEVVHVGGRHTFPGPAGPNVRFVDRVDVDEADDTDWFPAWVEADRVAGAAIEDLAPAAHRLAGAVWRASAGGVLVVGSSSVVRDLDLLPPGPAPDLVVANRGLAGIDGMLSTAAGVALAAGRPATAFVGDLTFLHGANGLLIGPAEPRPDLRVVVASDDGGAIFSLLEQGAPPFADAFERIYGTPTGADLAALCRAHGVAHEIVAVDDLARALTVAPRGLSVVEVPLDRSTRRADAAALSAAAVAAF